MKTTRKSGQAQDFATNCEACGEECMNAELDDVVLRGIDWKLRLCKTCKAQDPIDAYNDVIDIVMGVVKG
jgi:hypothetical protein